MPQYWNKSLLGVVTVNSSLLGHMKAFPNGTATFLSVILETSCLRLVLKPWFSPILFAAAGQGLRGKTATVEGTLALL